MIGRGTVGSILRVGLVVLVAVAAAVVANIVLLGVASGPKDPVGKLSPRAGLVELPAKTPSAPSAPSPGGTATNPGEDHAPGAHPDD